MDKMDNPPTDIVLKVPPPFNYPVGGDLMPHCQIPMERCRNDSCIYLQSEDIRQSSFFEKQIKTASA